MIKLGLWNRLAVVATGLALLIAPVMVWTDMAGESYEGRQAMLGLCQNMAEINLERDHDAVKYGAAHRECWAQLERDSENYGPGWNEWWLALLGTFAVCVVLYLLLWAAVLTAKWVWRGRRAAV